jgi:hypothetical protein
MDRRASESKIGLDDTLEDAITKVAQGNPGALTILLAELSPGDRSRDTMRLLHLDTLGLRGAAAWRASRPGTQDARVK